MNPMEIVLDPKNPQLPHPQAQRIPLQILYCLRKELDQGDMQFTKDSQMTKFYTDIIDIYRGPEKFKNPGQKNS